MSCRNVDTSTTLCKAVSAVMGKNRVEASWRVTDCPLTPGREAFVVIWGWMACRMAILAEASRAEPNLAATVQQRLSTSGRRRCLLAPQESSQAILTAVTNREAVVAGLRSGVAFEER